MQTLTEKVQCFFKQRVGGERSLSRSSLDSILVSGSFVNQSSKQTLNS